MPIYMKLQIQPTRNPAHRAHVTPVTISFSATTVFEHFQGRPPPAHYPCLKYPLTLAVFKLELFRCQEITVDKRVSGNAQCGQKKPQVFLREIIFYQANKSIPFFYIHRCMRPIIITKFYYGVDSVARIVTTQ
jgi:hypothetical protein